MEKSNFKVITNEEIQVALSAQYRLNLPIVVNETKARTYLYYESMKNHQQVFCCSSSLI